MYVSVFLTDEIVYVCGGRGLRLSIILLALDGVMVAEAMAVSHTPSCSLTEFTLDLK